VLSALVVLFAAWGGWSLYRFYRDEFPDVAALKTQYPVVEYRGRNQPFEVRLVRGRPAGWVSLSAIARPAVGAVLVSEDWAFFQHHGYDAQQIRQAVKESWEEGRLTRGASTITQQVVKNVFLERDKTLWRKLKELWLATRLEEAVGKQRILEVYLNVAEWGEGIFGIGAASRRYFGKSPGELTAKESAFLAMLLPSPKRYSQSFRARSLTRYASSTVRRILRKMHQAGYLAEEQRLLADITPLPFEDRALEPLPQLKESTAKGDAEESGGDSRDEGSASDSPWEGDPDALPEDSPAGEDPGSSLRSRQSDLPAAEVTQRFISPESTNLTGLGGLVMMKGAGQDYISLV
jgi:monofunctional biosynthetic peptidoglycan transglycosylase